MIRLLALLAATLALAATPAAGAAAPAPRDLLLRLPDLGPGYMVSPAGFSAGDRACIRLLLPANELRDVSRLRYRGCVLMFGRAWTPPGEAPGPDEVWSIAFAFEDPEGPRTALERPRALASTLLSGPRRAFKLVEPAPAIGDEAVLMRVDVTIPRTGDSFSVGVVAWRSGSTLSVVATFALQAGNAAVETAVRLATVQQARIAMPTPLRLGDNDDREVLLDDPHLGVPVQWLGRRLPAAGGRPELRLRYTADDVWGLGRPRPLPRVKLVYSTRRLPESVTIELWRPRALRRALRRPYEDRRCIRRTDAGVEGMRATISTIHFGTRTRCDWDGFPFYRATAFLPGVAVVIDPTGCCRSEIPHYASPADLRALLRALRPREPSG